MYPIFDVSSRFEYLPINSSAHYSVGSSNQVFLYINVNIFLKY